MTDELFPKDRIYPNVLRLLTSSEQIALRFLLASRGSRGADGPLPMIQKVYDDCVATLFRKLEVQNITDLVLRTVQGDPEPRTEKPADAEQRRAAKLKKG